jgi:drug/metabolite transporter (DMT)-like permease
MRNQTKAYAYGLTTVLLWSTVASAFKLSLRHVDHFQLLFYACAVSILVLSVILVVQGRWRLVLSYSGWQYGQSLALGVLNPFLYYLVLFKAYDLLPAQEAQPLNYTWALTLVLLSVPLLGQRLGVRELLAGLVSYSGVVVISVRGGVSGLRFSDPVGVALALGSTVIWALYWIYNTKDDRDPVAGLWLNFVFGFPFVLAACWLFSDLRVASLAGLLGAAYVGTFEMGITFVCWLMALRLAASSAQVGYLVFISPFLSLVFINLLVGEVIRVATLAGLGLIVAGLVVQHAARPRRLTPDKQVG